ncbi:MAG TPA: hypothetical protein VFH29_08405 [Anaerolineales bacterium]|nr:hypothetical protein [Anaerolineales bacterium]
MTPLVRSVLALLAVLSCTIMQPLEDEEERQYQRQQDAIQLTWLAQYMETAAALKTQAASIGGTQTAIASLEAEWYAAQTAEAVPAADAPAPAPLEVTAAPGSHAPIITAVDFLDSMPADGNRYYGWVSFTDAGGDVNRIRLETVYSTTPTKNYEGDPREHMQGNPTAGKARIGFYCTVPGMHTNRVTLFDEAGNSSNSMEYTFECYKV